MNLLKRIRLHFAARKLAKLWRNETGGSCRYSFDIGGSVIQFSSKECVTLEEFAEVLRGAADMIEAPTVPVTDLI
jgi:hypothetical protein